jgi:ribosomal protein S18 acetylase RimI-like enzyme
MQRLGAEVWRLRPDLLNGDCSVGELAWVFARLDHEWKVWRDGADVVAFAFFDGDSLVWQVHPERLDLLGAVLDSRPFELTHVSTGFDLSPFGFVRDDDAPWHHTNTRPLDGDIAEPTLPAGFRHVTMATAGDVAGFVGAHVRAWEGSKLDVTAYERVMRTWPYRADLDVAVQAPDGTFVATANVWLDEANATAELEPVGTDPAYRRLGIGRAMNLFAMHQARAAGARTMMVGCRGDDAYPIPRQLYWSVGFRSIARDVTWRRP